MAAVTIGVHPEQLHGLRAAIDKDDVEAAADGFGGGRRGGGFEGHPFQGWHGVQRRLRSGGEFIRSQSAETAQGGGVLFVLGEVTPFVGVGVDVVKFLIAAGVADVAEAFGAEAEAAGLGQVREGNVRPIGVGIFQERQQARAVMVRVRRQTGEPGERGREAEQANGFGANAGARAGRQAESALGYAQDERHAGAHAPGGEFLPVLFFAEMPAVIGPERDDGVAGVGPLLQGIEYVAEHGVGKVNGGEVALHGGFPLLVLADVGAKPRFGPRRLPSGGRSSRSSAL